MWFLRGQTDNKILVDKNVHIWDNWAVKQEDIDKFAVKLSSMEEKLKGKEEDIKQEFSVYLNEIGGLYGAAWRNAPGNSEVPLGMSGKEKYNRLLSDKKKIIDETLEQAGVTVETANDETVANAIRISGFGVDQIEELLHNLKVRPYSSRLVVSAWIPEWVPSEELSPQENVLLGKGALAACHCMFQFFVSPPKEEGGKKQLTCLMFQRSMDTPVGAPLNIASYAMLTMMIAQVVDMEALELIINVGDAHIYKNQVDNVHQQLERDPLPLPTLSINPDVKDILAFEWSDITLNNYQCHEAIRFAVST